MQFSGDELHLKGILWRMSTQLIGTFHRTQRTASHRVGELLPSFSITPFISQPHAAAPPIPCAQTRHDPFSSAIPIPHAPPPTPASRRV
jgi:hypothetical protein